MRLVKFSIVAALCAAACAKEAPPKPAPPPREVDVMTLAPSEVRDTGEYLGSLLTRQSVTVMPQIAGYVRNILVRPGQRVTAGQALVEIDARTETAALDNAEANEKSAAANLELAKQTKTRSDALYKEGLLSAQDLERAAASLEAAEAAVRSAQAQVSQRKVQLQYYAVRAPFAGTAGDVLVRLGDFVTATTPLTSIAQSDVLEVDIAVPAERARHLRPNTPVEILDSDGSLLVTSTVYFVAPLANARTQLVDVKAVFRNTVNLRPNELVRARVIYGSSQALQIPVLSVVRVSGQAFALAVTEKDGKKIVQRRPIELGQLGEKAYVVKKGLEAGDVIATSSLQSLRDGAPIKPRVLTNPRASADEATPRAVNPSTGRP